MEHLLNNNKRTLLTEAFRSRNIQNKKPLDRHRIRVFVHIAALVCKQVRHEAIKQAIIRHATFDRFLPALG